MQRGGITNEICCTFLIRRRYSLLSSAQSFICITKLCLCLQCAGAGLIKSCILFLLLCFKCTSLVWGYCTGWLKIDRGSQAIMSHVLFSGNFIPIVQKLRWHIRAVPTAPEKTPTEKVNFMSFETITNRFVKFSPWKKKLPTLIYTVQVQYDHDDPTL